MYYCVQAVIHDLFRLSEVAKNLLDRHIQITVLYRKVLTTQTKVLIDDLIKENE